MVNIIKQEIEMETALKNKIEFICSFCNATPIIYNGSVRTIEHTNISYVEPHRIIIKKEDNDEVVRIFPIEKFDETKTKINMGMIGVFKNGETCVLNEEELFSTIPPDGITNNDYVFRENE